MMTPVPSTEKRSGSDAFSKRPILTPGTQRFGHRAVGKRADVFGGNRIHHGIGIALDVLCALERGAVAADDDHVLVVARGAVFQLLVVAIGILRKGGLCHAGERETRRAAENEGAPGGTRRKSLRCLQDILPKSRMPDFYPVHRLPLYAPL